MTNVYGLSRLPEAGDRLRKLRPINWTDKDTVGVVYRVVGVHHDVVPRIHIEEIADDSQRARPRGGIIQAYNLSHFEFA